MSVARISDISYQSLAYVMRIVNESRSVSRADPGILWCDQAFMEQLLNLLGRSIQDYLWTGAPVRVTDQGSSR